MPTYKVTPLLKTVIEGGYCIGCGACAAVPQSPFRMTMDPDGKYQPVLDTSHHDSPEGIDIGSVCPFYAKDNEDTIARHEFQNAYHYNHKIGHFQALYASFVTNPDARNASSSGGIVTWLLVRLLRDNFIQGVIHVGPNTRDFDDVHFKYQVSKSESQIRDCAKTRYYPVEMSRVLSTLESTSGHFAFVGLPCFVKSLNLLGRKHRIIRDKIAFTIAIFCGHMKTKAFAESLSWQLGIPPQELANIDFRHKLSRRPANKYGIQAESTSNVKMIAKKEYVLGTDWGLGFFKPKACDFCDDIVGETADLSSGDAWLPKYSQDSRGTSLLVVRNPTLDEILLSGAKDSDLNLQNVTPEEIIQSQAGNFRHRHDGLAYRLALVDDKGKWRPQKRVQPSRSHLSIKRKKIYELRSHLSEVSHLAFRRAKENNSYRTFEQQMAPLIKDYYYLNDVSRISLAMRLLAMRAHSVFKRTVRNIRAFCQRIDLCKPHRFQKK